VNRNQRPRGERNHERIPEGVWIRDPASPEPFIAPSRFDYGHPSRRDLDAMGGPATAVPEFLPCCTRDPQEPASQRYLDVCTGVAWAVVTGQNCEEDCGGHPLCRPCLDVAKATGWLT
jgi:hypothetical protein